MNERIKELAEQAGFIDRGTNHTAYMNFDHEKFAELIVRECVYWCNAHARDDGTAQRIAEDIKKDFGVEE